jgi:PAS domain S-box-containing protein
MPGSQVDITKLLQEEARKDRIRLIIGAVVAAVSLLVVIVAVYALVPGRMLGMIILVLFTLAVAITSVALILRLIVKMEYDSLGEGVHLVLESVPKPVIILYEDGNVAYCNNNVPSLYGFRTRQECNTFYSLVPEFQPDGKRSRDMLIRNLKMALNGEMLTFDFMQQKPDGEKLPLKITFARAFYGGRNHVIGYIEDMRQTLATQKKEQMFHERMQGILDASPLLCAVFDSNGYLTEVNKEAERMFGIPDKQIFIDHFLEFQPEYQPDGTSTKDKLLVVAKEAITHGVSRHEWMYQLRDGTPVPVEETMRALKVEGQYIIIAYMRDLREQIKNQEKDKLLQRNVHVMAEQLNGHVAEQASAVNESAAAIEEMIANVQSVTNSLSKNAVQVKELQSSSEVGHTGLNEVALDIREIGTESESLLEINSVMQNIASQTNLLSMNAAIEAAHAGESGRGFAVVADEIRKLAESSSAQSKTISVVLKKIKGAIDKITKSTENVLGKFNAIDDGIRTVAEQERNVLNAMEEQREGSKQVLQAIGQLSDITHQVKEDAQRMVEKHQEALGK